MQTRSQTRLLQTMANATSTVVSSRRSSTKTSGEPSSPVTRSQTKPNRTFCFQESGADCIQNNTKLENRTYRSQSRNVGITTRSGKVLSA